LNLKLAGKLTVLLLSLSLFLCSCGTKPKEKSDATGVSTATLSAVGDIFLTEDMLRDARTPSGTYDFMPLFQHIVMETAKSDITIGTLEGTFANADKDSYPDSLAADLARCGFDILQTANSYSVFQGLSGLIRTKSIIEDQGLHALGTFRTQEERDAEKVLIKEINGIRFAFIGITKGFSGMGLPADSDFCVNLLYEDYATDYEEVDRAGIRSLVEAAVAEDPDFIIASLHWGSENISGISTTQEEITDLLIEAGVDVILGSHSHRLEKIERRIIEVENRPNRECIIAYGLGDFCKTEVGKTNTSIILNLEFTKDHDTGDRTISDPEYIPVSTVDNGAKHTTRYQVVPTQDAIRLYENNYFLRIDEAAYESIKDDVSDLEETLFPPTEAEAEEE